jgi:PAS domain S-box-containing protein
MDAVNESLAAASESVEAVIITPELARRPLREPDLAGENRVLRALTQQIAHAPEQTPQRLAELMLELYGAGSAGISRLEQTADGDEVFRWVAVAGRLKACSGACMPADAMPCRVVRERNEPLLFSHPERAFPYLGRLGLEISEALSIPAASEGRVMGTLWVLAHDDHRKFDLEDVRLLTSLAELAATAWRVHAQRAADDERARISEARLREQLDLNRTITDNTPSCLLMMDTQGRGTFVNPAAERITGFKSAELIGQVLHKLVHHTHADGTAFPIEECPIVRALPVGASVVGYEDVFVHKDGHFYPVRCNARPILKDGKPVGTVIEVQDITEEKRTREALIEANRRKDQFLAILAHELRNPLAPLSNALALWRLVEHDRAKMQELRGIMERQLGQMRRLIDDLLDVSRITRGKIELKKARVDLNEVLGGAAEAAQPLIEERCHRLELALPSTPLYLNADGARLMQVFGNLLHNAAKYTLAGGLIRLGAVREGDTAIVRVRDNGPGIPPQMHDAVFEMFVQVDTTLERSHGGMGLGLTLAKRLVEMHAGRIEVAPPTAGEGTEFIVRLPAIADAKPQPSSSPQEASHALAGKASLRVLVVDDNEASADTLGLIVETFGY